MIHKLSMPIIVKDDGKIYRRLHKRNKVRSFINYYMSLQLRSHMTNKGGAHIFAKNACFSPVFLIK